MRCLLGASSSSASPSAAPSLSLRILHTQADTTSTIEYRLARPERDREKERDINYYCLAVRQAGNIKVVIERVIIVAAAIAVVIQTHRCRKETG